MSDSDEEARPAAKASAFAAAGLLDSDSDEDAGTVPAAAPKVAAAKPAAAPAKAAPAAKGSKGKKSKGAKADDDDLDALLSELGSSAPAAAAPAATPSPAAPAAPAAADAKGAAAAYMASLGLGDEEPSKDKEKKKKKKKKAGGGAAADGSDDDGEGAAAASAAAGGAGAPASPAPAPKKEKEVKLSAAARAALERQAAVRAADERAAKEAAEKQARADALRAIEEEEERKRREKREREREKERAKKEREKADGTYMTKKQREALELRRARLGVGVGTGTAAAAAEASEDGAEAAAGAEAEAEAGGAAAAAAAAAGAGGKKRSTAALYAGARQKRGPAAGAGAAAAAEDVAAADAAAAAAAAAPAATDAAPAAAAVPAVLSVLAGAGDWEEAADDWETKAELIAAAATTTASSITSPSSSASTPAGAGAGSGSVAPASTPGPAGVATPAAVAATPTAVAAALLDSRGRRIPTAGESAGKPLEDRIDDSRRRREARMAAAVEARSAARLRSPICVVLGHVDTGKTSLLDKIRRTNVQEGEAGGITQQIGATYFPMERLRAATDKMNKDLGLEYKIPGLLIMDTPGHESFVNLRSRGAGLCDIAVLVVDVMHGLERQTIESIQLLRQKRTPFVVALNKIDRMYGWKANPNTPVRETLALQADYAVSEFETRSAQVMTQLAEQGLNAKLYYDNDDFRRNVSVVPTSAFTGEGIPDLLMLIVQLTQQMMAGRLMFLDAVQATVLEVKSIDGLGTTVDVVLVSGELREGDTIVVCGMEGPIVTPIRALLTPPAMREMRVKSDYVHHKSIGAAMGVKISAQGLDKAVAGTALLVAHADDEIEDLKEEVMQDFEAVMKGFKRDAVGVMVQASTLGSLEALLEYLRTRDPPVPVANVGIGPLHKKDIVAASIMLEHRKEYATILAFDVKVTAEARAAAEDLGVTIFTADIIYHLTDQFDAYLKRTLASKQAATAADAVFPAICRIIPTAIFNKRDPIVLGVDVLEGKLRVGTPLCVLVSEEKRAEMAAAAAAAGGAGGEAATAGVLAIGRVASIEHDHKAVDSASPGGPSVAVKIVPEEGHAPVTFGRQFDASALLYSKVSRTSIDILKDCFRTEMTKENWKTVIKLKGLLSVD